MPSRLAAALLLCLVRSGAEGAQLPVTVAETSGFVQTGGYEEVQALCAAYAKMRPDDVRCLTFGQTAAGRPMVAIVVSRGSALKGRDASGATTPVVLLQGAIHGGEPAGKDAGFIYLRELLNDVSGPSALKRLSFIFVPVVNVDGYARFGPLQRPNQAGPSEAGWRVTAQNLDLNRDYLKADTPEMRALLRLLNEWDPILYVDLHTTDGARFEYEIGSLLEPVYIGDEAMRTAGRALQKEFTEALTRSGSAAVDFYPLLRDPDDPASGFFALPSAARYAVGYWALRNRYALLIEAHSWKDYRTRVRATRNALATIVDIAARDAGRWERLARAADDGARTLGGQAEPLSFRRTDKFRTIEFKGYAYTHEVSAVSGGVALRYDSDRPQIWHVPFYDDIVPDVEVTAPTGGYVVPPEYAEALGSWFELHEIEYQEVGRRADLPLEQFIADQVTFGSSPVEGRMRLTSSGTWSLGQRAVAAGSLYVPVAQPKARLVLAALEPQSPESFLSWGHFNSHFVAVEYMENYVAEEVAGLILEVRPDIEATFTKRLRDDSEFARSAAARLEFFHRLHPSWDTKRDLYPIMRIDAEGASVLNVASDL